MWFVASEQWTVLQQWCPQKKVAEKVGAWFLRRRWLWKQSSFHRWPHHHRSCVMACRGSARFFWKQWAVAARRRHGRVAFLGRRARLVCLDFGAARALLVGIGTKRLGLQHSSEMDTHSLSVLPRTVRLPCCSLCSWLHEFLSPCRRR